MRNFIKLIFTAILLSTHMVYAQGNRQLVQDNPPTTVRRLALVIGNGKYTNAPLKNPPNDAADMAAALKELGFEVLLGTDLGKNQLRRLIADFGSKLQPKGIGLFYYSGHGLQVGGRNYIVPVDANITNQDEVEFEAVSLDSVTTKLAEIEGSKNIVIIDACRSNPFSRSARDFNSGNGSNRARGLATAAAHAKQFPTNIHNPNSKNRLLLDAPTGMVIAYAAAPGQCATDGSGRNGLYTQELLKNIKTSNITVEEVFRRVRTSVRSLSQGRQVPWEESSLVEDLYLAGKKEIAAMTLPESTGEQVNPAVLPLGRYFALVIGINTYQSISRLQMAETDARVVSATLRERYGFQTKLLLNVDATRQKIFEALENYRANLTESDNLLIYYAGHGYFDRETNNAYWLPVDATKSSKANWVSANDITSDLRAIPAKHILIVSDSCYSGTLTRQLEYELSTSAVGREKFLQKMLAGKSRNLMASGGNEPVSDGGGGKHSVFASAFLFGLAQMERNAFTASELFQQFVQERVTGNSDQTPEYNPLRNSGHDRGDFVFIRKK